MLEFILRRLLIMIPTLLGISLITLTLIHLAPGDPVQIELAGTVAKGAISAEEIEAMRRTYYLHLPVLFNPHPEDAASANAKALEAFSDPDLRQRGIRPLAFRGLVALTPALELVDAAPEKAREPILTALRMVAVRMGIDDQLSDAPDPIGFWKQVEAALPPDPWRAADQAITQLEAAPDSPEALEAVVGFDTFAMDGLVHHLQQVDPASKQAKVLSQQLSRITDVNLAIRSRDALEQRAQIVDDWRYWWGPLRADYVMFDGIARVTAMFTETQYAKWLKRLVTLDFDRSSRDRLPIRKKLARHLNVTLVLALSSMMIGYLAAIPLGVFSAVNQFSTADRIVTTVLFVMYSLPTFWVAMLLQQYLCGVEASSLSLFPLLGLGVDHLSLATFTDFEAVKTLAWHLILPVFVLSYRSFSYLSRYQRVGMLDVIRQDYIRTARAKGLPERVVIWKHGLRNSVLPIITLIGTQFPFLVGGAVIVETIFQINGMGLETLEAIRTRDINWIMAAVTVTSLVTMTGVLLSDVVNALVDPRLQDSSSRQAT